MESSASPPEPPRQPTTGSGPPDEQAVVGSGPPAETAPGPPRPPSDYPVRFSAERQADYNRALPFFKWLLAFPHYIVLALLAIGAVFVHLIAFFAVLITGRYPRGLWDYIAGLLRWGSRVGAYVYLLTDRYPPFSLADSAAHPVRLEIDYPDHVNRWRPLVHWLLILPYAFVAGLLMQLAAIVALIGAFVILFTKELPPGMFTLILNPFGWQVRASAYANYLVTRYPPFEWD